MKNRIIPVVFTAALTSVATIFALKHFDSKMSLPGGASTGQVPVNYVAFNPETMSGGKATGANPDFQFAAESSVKAVVHIKTTINSRTVLARDPLAEFFGGDGVRQYRTPEQMGSGSGVIISPDGYVVTNNHVIAGTDVVTVTFNDRNTAKAKVIGTDPSTDLAVLKIDEKNLPYMEFGNSDDVHLGQWVLAVGYPFTLDATVTAGVVSAKSRSIGINATKAAGAIESFIQTDAAVNPGNSGGALVNTGGQLVGINSAIASPTGSYAGYSYAIPANIVKKVAGDIIQYGAVQRAYLGIEPRDFKSADPQEVAKIGLDKQDGVYVAKVAPSGGAAAAGIKEGDFIMAINGARTNTVPQLLEQIARYKPGDNVTVTYLRSGKSSDVTVMLKNINGTTAVIKEKGLAQLLGASFRSLNIQEQKQYRVDGGAIITSVGDGLLSEQTNIQKGFVVTGVNDRKVTGAEMLMETMNSNSPVIQLEGFYPGRNGMYYYNIRRQ